MLAAKALRHKEDAGYESKSM